MKKINILLVIALMAVIYSCGNSGKGSNEQAQEREQSSIAKQENPYITLGVKKGVTIGFKLDIKKGNTEQIKIVSGSRDTTFEIKGFQFVSYLSADTQMTIYGKITDFACDENGDKLNALNISNNTDLETLSCYMNNIEKLNIGNNRVITTVYCYYNKLKKLDVSSNTALSNLFCSGNNLTNLDISKNTALTKLGFGNKGFSSLDISNNKSLKNIICSSDLPRKCYNEILKSLPNRKGLEKGEIRSSYNGNYKKIDKEKNWEIINEVLGD